MGEHEQLEPAGMPQLNTSEAVRQRVNQLITRLVEFANGELAGCEHLVDKVRVRWIDPDSQSPRLVVETEIRFLAELVFQQPDAKTKDYLKQDLRTLEKFLGILEDNRTQTQGSSTWRFTLRLWRTSVAKNLEKLNEGWDRRKQIKAPSSPLDPSPIAVYPLPPPKAPAAEIPLSETSELNSEAQPQHNLPAKDYGRLIDRDSARNRLWRQLVSDQCPARIGVKGMGGIGKTSLALAVADQVLSQRTALQTAPDTWRFDAIIFASAQPRRLSPYGILERHRYEPTLLDLFRAIAQTLERPEALLGDANEQLVRIQALLNRQSTLLILDNLDAIAPDSQRAILSFLYDLPSTVKALVISRDYVTLDTLVALEPLSLDAGLELIEHQAQLKSVKLSSAEARRLFDYTGGIPAAMVYAIGQLAGGYPLSSVLPKLTLPTGDYCRYYLESAVTPLRGQPAHRLLMALALFPQPALPEAIARVALDPIDLGSSGKAEGFATLNQRSLVVVQHSRYSLPPLTLEYALAELNAHPEFELAARERWLGWAWDCLRQLAAPDWREWSEHTLPHQDWGNLQAVIEWCIEQDRYDAFSQFWPLVKGYTYIHGYWNERLTWLTWWVEAAQARQDRTVIAQALRDKGWTLMLMGHRSQLAEAAVCFEQVWADCDRADSLFQLELAIEYVTVLLQQEQLEPARRLLAAARGLLTQLEACAQISAQLDPSAFTKQAIRVDYYSAEVEYRQGNYDQAKDLYQQVLVQAKAAQWVQVEVYTLNWQPIWPYTKISWMKQRRSWSRAYPWPSATGISDRKLFITKPKLGSNNCGET